MRSDASKADPLLSPTSPQPPQFYLRVPEGKVFGPATLAELDCWVQEGRLDAQCEIRPAESNLWQKATRRYPVLGLPEEVGAGSPFQTNSGPDALGTYYLSSRGGLVLLLALLGLVGFCPIFSVTAWTMAYTDLEHMSAKRMNLHGRTMVLTAYYLGMLVTVGFGLMFVAVLMLSLLRFLI